ncbi:hypothetical protein [Streptomyces sp. MNP-20]|uniref:hypothetical protein n=1 Tax=Streptomyces sp. MNP-20 TaxID=2721165 RepID=UPI0015563982|nr:hypothetical protein [Streptomyces sp. MNP-20]
MNTRHPSRRAAAHALLVGLAAALLALSGCSSDDTTPGDKSTRTPITAPRDVPRGIVTRAEAHQILNRYQRVNNQANRVRDAKLLATVEAGQLYARSKAELQQFDTFSAKKKKDYAAPFGFRERSFYIPAEGDWFAAEATTSAGARTLMVFEKFPGGQWKKVFSAFPDRSAPSPDTRRGVAATAAPHRAVGRLAPRAATAAVEDLFITGGKRQGRALSHTGDRARRILKTHKERAGDPGGQALTSFTPARPVSGTSHALRTRTGVLAFVPLAHRQNLVAAGPNLRIQPDSTEAVYNDRPRPAVIDTYQGEALVLFPGEGKPKILDYRYAMVDSR